MAFASKSTANNWYGRMTRYIAVGINAIMVWGGPTEEERKLAFNTTTNEWTQLIKEVPAYLQNLQWMGDYQLIDAVLTPKKFLGFAGPKTGHWHEPREDNNHGTTVLYRKKVYTVGFIFAGCGIANISGVDYILFAKHNSTHIRFYKQILSEFISSVSLTEFASRSYIRDVTATKAESVWFSGDGMKAVWLDQSEFNTVDDADPDGVGANDRFFGYLDTRTNKTREYQFSFSANLTSVSTVIVDGAQPTIVSIDTGVGDPAHDIIDIEDNSEQDTITYDQTLTLNITYDHEYDLCAVYVDATIKRVSYKCQYSSTFSKTSHAAEIWTRYKGPPPDPWFRIGLGVATVSMNSSGSLLYRFTTPPKTYEYNGSFTASTSGGQAGYATGDPAPPSFYTNTASGEGYNIFGNGALVRFGFSEQAFLPEIYTGAKILFNYIDLYNDVYSHIYYSVQQNISRYIRTDLWYGVIRSYNFKQSRHFYDSVATITNNAQEEDGIQINDTVYRNYPSFKDDFTDVPPAETSEYQLLRSHVKAPQLPFELGVPSGGEDIHSSSFSGNLNYYETFLFPHAFISSGFNESFCSIIPFVGGTLYEHKNRIPIGISSSKDKMNVFVNWAKADVITIKDIEHVYATDADYNDLIDKGSEIHYVLPV